MSSAKRPPSRRNYVAALSINPIGIEFARLQVANPNDGWKNVFETGKVKFALNFGQLLRGKFIIETMEMNDLILGTKRTTDGSIPKPPKVGKPVPPAQTVQAQQLASDSTSKSAYPPPSLSEQAKPALAPQESKPSASYDLDKIKRELKVDSLLNPKNLATLQRIDTLKKQINP